MNTLRCQHRTHSTALCEVPRATRVRRAPPAIHSVPEVSLSTTLNTAAEPHHSIGRSRAVYKRSIAATVPYQSP
jgi:hypothetical protein